MKKFDICEVEITEIPRFDWHKIKSFYWVFYKIEFFRSQISAIGKAYSKVMHELGGRRWRKLSFVHNIGYFLLSSPFGAFIAIGIECFGKKATFITLKFFVSLGLKLTIVFDILIFGFCLCIYTLHDFS